MKISLQSSSIATEISILSSTKNENTLEEAPVKRRLHRLSQKSSSGSSVDDDDDILLEDKSIKQTCKGIVGIDENENIRMQKKRKHIKTTNKFASTKLSNDPPAIAAASKHDQQVYCSPGKRRLRRLTEKCTSESSNDDNEILLDEFQATYTPSQESDPITDNEITKKRPNSTCAIDIGSSDSMIDLIANDDIEGFIYAVHAGISHLDKQCNTYHIATIMDILLDAITEGAYKCIDFLLSIDYRNAASSVATVAKSFLGGDSFKEKGDSLAAYIDQRGNRKGIVISPQDDDFLLWMLQEPPSSTTSIKLNSKMPFPTYKTSCVKNKPNPLAVAVTLNRVDIVRLICERCPCYAIHSLAQRLEADDPDSVPLLFHMVESDDSLLLQIMLHTVDEALLPSHPARDRSLPPTALRHPSTVAVLRTRIEDDGSTVMHWAAEKGNQALVTLLLSLDMGLVSITDYEGRTPLHCACLLTHHGVLNTLLDHGADASLVDSCGWSPFMYSIYAGSPPCLVSLIKRSGQTEEGQGSWGAVLHNLTLLGEAIVQQELDEKLQSVIESLTSVPEFYSMLNDIIAKTPEHIRANGKLSFVNRFPFLLTLKNKLKLAHTVLSERSGRVAVTERYPVLQTVSTPQIRFLMRRTHVWRDYCDIVSADREPLGGPGVVPTGMTADDKARLLLRRSLMFQFEEESGVGRGVEREVLSVLCRGLVDGEVSGPSPCRPLFVPLTAEGDSFIPARCEDDGREGPRRGNRARNEDAVVRGLEVFGTLVAHMLLRIIAVAGGSSREGQEMQDVLSFNVSSVLWKLVLERPVTLADIATLDAELYQNLQYLLTNDGAEQLSLTFAVADESCDSVPETGGTGSSVDQTGRVGSLKVTDLVKNGSKKAVTDKNKKRYVDLVLDHKVTRRLSTQAAAIRRGILKILSEDVLHFFSEFELGQLMSGSMAVDVDEWEQSSSYVGYTSGDATLVWFWRLVREIGVDERALLLRFCTGCSRLPLRGFAGLYPPFTVVRVPFDPTRTLPTSSTCFNMLRLPIFKDEGALRRAVMTAIIMGSEGFSFA